MCFLSTINRVFKAMLIVMIVSLKYFIKNAGHVIALSLVLILSVSANIGTQNELESVLILSQKI